MMTTFAIGTRAPNSLRWRERHVDAEHPDEAAILARIERAMRCDGGYDYRAVRTSDAHPVTRAELSHTDHTDQHERSEAEVSGWQHACMLIDDDVWGRDWEGATQLLPALPVVALMRLPKPRGLRPSAARVLLWLAAHLTRGRASWRLVTLATRLIVGGDADTRLAFLACAVGLMFDSSST